MQPEEWREDQNDIEDDDEKLDERIKLLEGFKEFIQNVDQKKRENADPEELKKDILENISKLEEIKQNYPAEIENNADVLPTIARFEKGLTAMIAKLEEGGGLDEEEVKGQIENDENRVLAATSKFIDLMKREKQKKDESQLRNGSIGKPSQNPEKSHKVDPVNIFKSQAVYQPAKGRPIPTEPAQLQKSQWRSPENPNMHNVEPAQLQKSQWRSPENPNMHNVEPAQLQKSQWRSPENPNMHNVEPASASKSILNFKGAEVSNPRQEDNTRRPPNPRPQSKINESVLLPKKTEPEHMNKSINQVYFEPKDSTATLGTPNADIPVELIQYIRKTLWKQALGESLPQPKPAQKDPHKSLNFLENKPFDDFDSRIEFGAKTPDLLFNSEPGCETVAQHKLFGGEGAVSVIKVVDETVLAVGYCSGETVFYSMADFKVLSKSKEHTGSISAMESGKLCLPDGGGMISNYDVLMTGGNEADQTIVVWDMSNFTPMKRLRGHNHMITAIVDLGDYGTIMTGAMDAQLAFWDMRQDEPTCIQTIEDLAFPITVVKFDVDDGILTVGTLDGQVGMWQTYFEDDLYVGCSLIRIVELQGHIIEIIRSHCLPRCLIAVESDFCVRCYDLKTGKIIKMIKCDRPIIDAYIIENSGTQDVTLFVTDISNKVHRISSWNQSEESVLLKSGQETEAKVKRYIGYNPGSQIFIKGRELFLLTCDQQTRILNVNKLHLE